jgi:hypothetical protein
MTDTKFYKVMGALQIMIAFINFYVANQAAATGATLGYAVAALCTVAGVFTTVLGAKMMGILDK